MRLSCKRGMQIAIYSAMFGRTQQGTLECPLYHRRAPSVGERTFQLQNFSAGSGTLSLLHVPGKITQFHKTWKDKNKLVIWQHGITSLLVSHL